MISIIVPVYNAEKYLRQCVDSIIAQTYKDWELLLVVDGGNDNSDVICDEYAEKYSSIRVFHQQNAGVSSARNVGLENARGEWVTFADSDDWFESSALEDYISCAEESNADVVRGGYYRHLGNGKVEKVVADDGSCFSDVSRFFCFLERAQLYSWVWTMMVKRECIGDIRFNENINYLEDHIFSYQCYFNCKRMAVMAKPTYHYVVHETGSLSTCKNPYVLKEAAEQEYLLKTKMVGGKDAEMQRMVDDCYQYHLHSIVIALYQIKYAKSERNQFSKMQRLLPQMKYPHEKVFFSRYLPFFVKEILLRYIINK